MSKMQLTAKTTNTTVSGDVVVCLRSVQKRLLIQSANHLTVQDENIQEDKDTTCWT